MFPSLNEAIGWNRGLDSIPPSSTIILGDSNPLDTLPFIYTFMNFWLKHSNPVSIANPVNPTSIIFVAFKSSQNRINTVFRKLYGVQLNLLAAQSRYAFIDAVNAPNHEHIITGLEETLKKMRNSSRSLVILEGFSWNLASGISSVAAFTNLFTKIQSLTSSASANLLIQWSRDLEEDYPGRNPQLIEDVRLGGAGWLFLLSRAHYIFCARPLKSGMTRDASGEIVVALGLAMQNMSIQDRPFFHPIIALFKIQTDNLIQSFTKGNL